MRAETGSCPDPAAISSQGVVQERHIDDNEFADRDHQARRKFRACGQRPDLGNGTIYNAPPSLSTSQSAARTRAPTRLSTFMRSSDVVTLASF